MLRKLFVFVICLMAAVATASAQTPPDNEIWYTTTYGEIADLFIGKDHADENGEDFEILSHTYKDGKGVIRANKPFKTYGCEYVYEEEVEWVYGFYIYGEIESIILPKCLTTIGYKAFEDCSSLTSITIPESVTEIKDGAFSGCSSLPVIDNIRYADTYLVEAVDESLTSYSIKKGTRFIGSWAFARCNGLTSIIIPESVTSIGGGAFLRCSGLTSITIPNSVASIGVGAFAICSSLKSFNGKFASSDSRYLIKDGELIAFAPAGLTSYTIPNSVTSIGGGAFYDCSSLTIITIPNSVTSIGHSAFSGCSSLTSITIPNSVTEIGWGAFYGCSGLKSITIPNSVTSIEYGTFWDCSSLTSITIPNSVTSIGDSAFDGCSSLTSITIPNSVTSIGKLAFCGCSSLPVIDNIRYADTYLVEAVDESLTSYSIKKGTRFIGDGAFIDCSGLTSITISNSVTSIGEYAFAGCSNLKSITIGNSVTEIGDDAFYGCSSLTSITIPNSVTSIEFSAFEDCSSLTSITIPNSITSIGNYAFEDCSSLTSITIPKSVTSIGESAFKGCSSLKSVKVANKYCYDYFKDKVANIAFYGANASADGKCLIVNGELQRFIGKRITEYTIPESVTSIESWAFNGCTSLTSITCLATTPLAIDYLGIAETTMIYVPKEAVKAYKKDLEWSIYKKQIKAIK